MKKGFTLTEVLITIVTIGIVAALTIPAVIAKYQKHVLYTQFMNAYSTFSQVYMQLKAEGLTEPYVTATNEDTLSKLKYTLKCKAYDNTCNVTDEQRYYKNLAGVVFTSSTPFFYHGADIYSLPNGADFNLHGGINVDVNGMEKGPNIVGRDRFEFHYNRFQKSLSFNTNCYSNRDYWQREEVLQPSNGFISQMCSTTYNSSNFHQGACCGLKLLKEGKMDY